MDEKKAETIKKEARKILDKFANALKGIKAEEVFVKRDEDRRIEGGGVECESDFRKIMFENAPQKNKDFIITERKKW